MDFSATSVTSENVILFVFTSVSISFGVCIYAQYFFDADLVKRSSSVYQKKKCHVKLL